MRGVPRSWLCALFFLSIGCETASDPGALPALDDGFVLLRAYGNDSNATIDRINLDVVGLAIDGDRIAVLTFFGATGDDFGAGPPPTFSAQTLHVSEDGGRSFTEYEVTPASESELAGRLTGLAFAGDRLVSRLLSEMPSAIAIVELDPASGTYTKLTPTIDGREVFPQGHVYVDGDALVWASSDAYLTQLYANRVDLASLETRAYSFFAPTCTPSQFLQFQAGTWLFPALLVSGGTVQSLCSSPSLGTCEMRWRLRDDMPIDADLTAAPCASEDAFYGGDDSTEFEPRVVRATAGGFRVAGVQDGARAVIRGMVRSPSDTGPLRLDLGPGSVLWDDVHGFGPKLADAFAFVPACEHLTGTFGRCLDADERPLDPAIEPVLLAPVDEHATEYAPLAIARPCDDPAWCPTVPNMMARDHAGSRYYTVWQLRRVEHRGLTDYGTIALVGGWVDDPREPPEPPEPPTLDEVTPLELRCWAEVACDPWPAPVDAPPGYTEVRQHTECVQRWVRVRGAPDVAYERFLAADPLDCAALRAADPAGAACADSGPSCSPDGAALLCANTTWGVSMSCADANGASCSVDASSGQPGCYADACPAATSGAHCDALGRAVDCERGMVDDCPAHGLGCVSGTIEGTSLTLAGCSDPSLSCAAPGDWRRCAGAIAYSCDYGVPLLVEDCSRAGATCLAGGCESTTVPGAVFGCDGDVLSYPGALSPRRIDCASLGMRCREDGMGSAWCSP